MEGSSFRFERLGITTKKNYQTSKKGCFKHVIKRKDEFSYSLGQPWQKMTIYLHQAIQKYISDDIQIVTFQMKSERKAYLHQSRVIYEWDESLDTIYCYIELPPLPSNIKVATVLQIDISSSSLSVGFKGTPPYLAHPLTGIVDTQASLWYVEEKKDASGKKTGLKELVVELQKAQKGVRWGSVFKGHESLNALEEEELKKKLMLERFQEENPGFDFSGAEFNGQVPQARTFMGGPKT